MRTFSALCKKCFRDIGRNLKQFIAIIFIVAVAVTLFVGLLSNSHEFERRVNYVYEQGNVADIWVTIQPDFTSDTLIDEQYNELVEINGGDEKNVEKRLYLPSQISGMSSYGLLSKDFPKINTGYELDLSDTLNNENFFIVDKEFKKRYNILSGRELELNDTLTVTIDLVSLGMTVENLLPSSEEIFNNILTYIDQSNVLNENIKTLLKKYLENNKDKIIETIDAVLASLNKIETIEFDATVNGFMRHPENIQNATFNDSSYLFSSKLFLNKLVDTIKESVSVENETLNTIIASFFGDISNSISKEDNEQINKILKNMNNQFVIKLGDDKDLNTVKNQINKYYSDKTNLLALFDIDTMPSNAVIQNDIVQSRQLTYAFPVLFFAVAILVVLTTISQLILKERTQIGTLKSLGFSKGTILVLYMSMMAIIATIGTLLGFIVGPLLLPLILNIKYSILYSLPSLGYLFPFLEAFLVLIGIIVAVAFLTFLLIRHELSLTPANSMRPASPHIKFKEKKSRMKNISLMMALRNIKVHYAKSLMVVLGILGCTGLLICGMGIVDTIDYGMNVDLNSILASDLQITYNGGTKSGVVDQELLSLKDSSGNTVIDKAEEFSMMSTTVTHGEKHITSPLYYFDSTATNFKYDKWDDLNGEGIAINESKAEELGVGVGDKVSFSLNGETYTKQIVSVFYTFTVSGIFIYTETMPELSDTRTNCWVTLKEGYTEEEVQDLILNSEIKEINGVLTKTQNLKKVDSYMGNVDTMTNTIMAFALVLAIIVLINLSILNFRERLRDYATLKVLGFSRFEIARSMIYEVMILVSVGALLGMAAGLPLEMIVLGTNKTPLLSFKYVIFAQTYIVAFLITVLVAFLVNIFMTREIKKISMSESLKSVE